MGNRCEDVGQCGSAEEMASDRLDMSPEVLRERYDAQTEEDERGLRREFLDTI